MTDGNDTAIAFRQVSKSFGAKQILRDVSFEVPAGEALCILGRSGTGKSVTLKLIISLLKPDKGQVWVEQDDITRLNTSELSRVRRKMGFLFQDAALFDSLTLYENLALPLFRLTNKTPKEVDFVIDRVLHQVGLAGDKQKMPSELSGGMRKRAGLARALVLEPKILLADEPSSGLDAESEKLVFEALDRLMNDKTSIVIAHRLSTIRNADIIFVVKDGEIVERGRHEELAKSGGLYSELYELQSGEECVR